MIGYVQAKACTDWFAKVNRWIDDLASSGDPLWSSDHRLKGPLSGEALNSGLDPCKCARVK
jgi:hypothetical protein